MSHELCLFQASIYLSFDSVMHLGTKLLLLRLVPEIPERHKAPPTKPADRDQGGNHSWRKASNRCKRWIHWGFPQQLQSLQSCIVAQCCREPTKHRHCRPEMQIGFGVDGQCLKSDLQNTLIKIKNWTIDLKKNIMDLLNTQVFVSERSQKILKMEHLHPCSPHRTCYCTSD